MSENVSLNTDGVLLSEQRFLELCEAERKLAELQERERWIPVTERLPEHQQIVLVSGGIARYYAKGRCIAWEGFKSITEGPERSIEWQVTEWRPLPAPKEGK